jgi:hypothetical protein
VSLVAEILDRLTGLAVVKAQLDANASALRRMVDWLLDLERRVIRLESAAPPGATAMHKRPRLQRR